MSNNTEAESLQHIADLYFNVEIAKSCAVFISTVIYTSAMSCRIPSAGRARRRLAGGQVGSQ